MLAIIWNIASFVVALSILVAVHEWGHYIIAKLCKVKILRFSIGFGKPIYKRVTSTGMEFVIAAIPLGGYVRMLDGRVDEVGTRDLDVAFDQKPVLQRMAIVFAGPAVNFIFAAFALMAIGMIGTQTIKPIIGSVTPNSYAAAGGLQMGDEIIAIGDRSVNNWQDVSLEVVRYSGDNTIPMRVMTGNGANKIKQLPVNGWTLNPDSSDLFADLGFNIFQPEVTKVLAYIEENGPAAKAQLQIGDEILKLDGTPMRNWRQIVEYIESRPNTSVQVDVMREGGNRRLNVTLGTRSNDNSKGYLGVVTSTEPWPEQYVVTTQLGPIDAFINGVDDTWRLMTTTTKMLGKLITGDLSVKSLSGPISIAQGAGAHASYGLVAFLGFLALISVNLGIINLLPLPILDGGHLLYFTIEWITGKPVSEAIQEIGFKVGGALLFMVMATAIFNDILRNV
ncbi:MAG: RIP metalloprotease RseP [Glaciecola sp.]